MGYYTQHILLAKCKNLTPEIVDAIDDWLRERALIRYALEPGVFIVSEVDSRANFGEWSSHCECSWYEHETDMEALSLAFPDVTFCLHGEGEDRYDEWNEYWLNGDCETCCMETHMPEPDRIMW